MSEGWSHAPRMPFSDPAMNLSQQLAVERRQRLEAERLLKQRETELRKANARLAKHSVSLSVELDETRAETSAVTEKAKALETSYTQAQNDLARANEAIQDAEKKLWAALQTVRDGFALFDKDLRLIIANRAYLSIFDGTDLTFTGFDGDGDPRAFELTGHPFFIGTVFQPERAALQGRAHPLITAFAHSAIHSVKRAACR